ncbi:uncharacterized protein LOC127286419 isoform X2 [Leptopilina boulardi]|uniref:uncharacterized protein LOC127286419 isoform X2 n=1 Tax=Leptopilina boulardi TaxID=63433 RepID=UPI0021F59261|nr:uncharacterized protein LOC127286419 isoform X2 [Leptopilina boulardi]
MTEETESNHSVCREKPTHCLKIPLKSTEQIYLTFLIPTLLSCILYVLNFSADLVVAIQHFREDNPIWGCCTLAIIYLPALVYFILTVSRPDWWMTDDDKVTKGALSWFALQLCHLIAFPLFALYRYAGLIVLIVDAIMLSGIERKKTLNLAAAPAAMELYFFLQAWFQAAPQAVLQTHLLFRERTVERSQQSEAVQILCIIVSIGIMAMKTMSFQRYESQRVNGRKLPWALWLKKYRIQELNSFEEKAPLHAASPSLTKESNPSLADNSQQSNDENSNSRRSESRVVLERQISTTPPLPPKNAPLIPPPTPLRRITSFTPIPVPDMPAPPRPDSIINNESSMTTRSPQELNEKPSERLSTLIIPKRIQSTKGLDEDDAIGKFVSFLWWFLFILPRVISIAIFFESFPFYLLGILTVHYALMLTYLFYYAKYQDATTIFVNLWLGLVYIFSMIEYRIKFKYADKWIASYCTFVMLQNIALTIIWFYYGEWTGFWYTYAFGITFISMGLCISSSAIYYTLFKPGKRRVYAS